MGNYCLMGILFCVSDENILEIGRGDGCTTS